MSAQIKTGGPAFPCEIRPSEQAKYLGIASSAQYAGMTLRDYFIAHAPAEPQPWFEPTMPEARPADPNSANAPEHLRAEVRAELSDDFDVDVGPEATDWIRTVRSKVRAWDREREKQLYFQWPVAWADAMLAAREVQS